jgi:hypothetical protein
VVSQIRGMSVEISSLLFVLGNWIVFGGGGGAALAGEQKKRRLS